MIVARASATAALLLAAAAAAAPQALDPKDGVILPQSVAKEVLHQCSRATPQSVQNTWMPTAAQIRELEALLPMAVAAETQRRSARFRKYATSPMVRQYAGFVLAGRRVIYVNTLNRPFATDSGLPDALKPDWRHHGITVCDGGPTFFGVEYDPATKTFAHFAFNGPAI